MQGADLLRLLEPAVRPVSAPEGGRRATGNAPFEHQDFDDLLASARQGFDAEPFNDDLDDPSPSAEAKSPAGPLAELAAFSRIENPSLRNLLAAAGHPDAATAA